MHRSALFFAIHCPMINDQQIPLWKRALKGIALTLTFIVVLDWLFDGRLRQWLPFRKNGGQE